MKKKKIIIISVVAVLALALGIGAFISIKRYNDKQDSDDKIVYKIKDTLPDGEGKTLKVILLAGQSNASGCSLDEYLRLNVSEEKYSEYERGYDNVYINYLSGNNMSEEFVKCSTLQGELEGAFGPELGLAEKLSEMYPDEDFVIIKCAWGGTNLYEQWLSPSSDGDTGKLYKQFVKFVNTSIDYLEGKNYEVVIEAMCWMQGESDSFLVESAAKYGEHLNNFIEDIRDEFKDNASKNGIAFIDAYIADNPMFWVYCDDVNAGKREVSKLSDNNFLVDTIAEGLVTDKEPIEQPDIPHYDSMSEILLGHLFAIAASQYLDD